MATLAQTYTRIILELNRDDMGTGGELEQAKIDAVDRAIEAHADELFWFNRKAGTANTVAATATVALPSGMRLALGVSYNQAPLTKVPLDQIEHLTTAGVPTQWAENEGAIQLYPVPDGVYALLVTGIEELGTPASAASNHWTTTAYDLTVAEAKLRLCRGSLRDPEGASLALGERDEALGKLRRETRRRGGVNLQSDLPVPTGYNLLT